MEKTKPEYDPGDLLCVVEEITMFAEYDKVLQAAVENLVHTCADIVQVMEDNADDDDHALEISDNHVACVTRLATQALTSALTKYSRKYQAEQA